MLRAVSADDFWEVIMSQSFSRSVDQIGGQGRGLRAQCWVLHGDQTLALPL